MKPNKIETVEIKKENELRKKSKINAQTTFD